MKKIIHSLILVVLVSGIVCLATALASSPACAVTPRTAIGRPVDDGQAEPMSGICQATRCLGNQLQCLGQDGVWHTLAFCQNGCLNGHCK